MIKRGSLPGHRQGKSPIIPVSSLIGDDNQVYGNFIGAVTALSDMWP